MTMPRNRESKHQPARGDELLRLRSEVASQRRDIDARDGLGQHQETLIARLRVEAAVRQRDLDLLDDRLAVAELELDDLRAIRDALTPPTPPQRPGLDLAAAYVPCVAERVSGDFYFVGAGPNGSTVLVIGDVVGHGLLAARRAAFMRTVLAAIAPFSDDPARLLSWANTALIERAGVTVDYVTAACLTYLPSAQLLRWAYAGHPPAVLLDDGQALAAATQGTPLGLDPDVGCVEASGPAPAGTGVLLYTDGLTEARRGGELFGPEGVSATLASLHDPSASEAVAALRSHVSRFAPGGLTDDLCVLAARIR